MRKVSNQRIPMVLMIALLYENSYPRDINSMGVAFQSVNTQSFIKEVIVMMRKALINFNLENA